MKFAHATAISFMVSILLSKGLAMAGPVGIGVVGDSVSDEYGFSPAPRPTAQNYVEQLAIRRGLNFGSLSAETRGAPRNQGYEYNWAQSGARTDQIVPQVDGLAQQIAAGKVNRGIVYIGENNFRDVLTGKMNPAEASRAAITNTVAAVTKLLLADPDFRVAVGNVPDVTALPEARAALALHPELAAKFQATSAQIDAYNGALAAQFRINPRVALVDTNALFKELINGKKVGSLTLDPLTPGADPTHLFIDPIHPGEIAQTLLANEFLRALNIRFDDNILPFTQHEILQPVGVPLPPGLWATLGTLPILWFARRRMVSVVKV